METVSYSEIKLFRKCPKAWNYRYIERLERRRPSRPPFVGSILHDMLDAYVKVGRKGAWKVFKKFKREYAKLFREEQEEFGDVPQLVKAIYKGYWRRWKDSGLVFVDSEVEYRVELAKGIELLGYIDKIVLDHQRRLLLDHKFHKNLPGPEDRFSDIQTVLYFWGWNTTHRRSERVDGIMWDYGRMKAPTVPEVLKSGALSKAKKIDTDVYTFRKAIEDNGLSEKPYREFLKSLEGKERTFFERVPLPSPPKHMVLEVVEDARQTSLAIRRAKKTGVTPRSMSGFNCRGCEFRTVCEADVRGLDGKFVRKKEYQIRKKTREKKYGEVEEAA